MTTGTKGCELCLPGNYTEKSSPTGDTSSRLFSETSLTGGIHLVHGLGANMKNRLMSMWDKIMLRKRCVIKCINDPLKNKADIVHSRHRSVHNFIMNICAVLTAYSFFENKPEALHAHVGKSVQLMLLGEYYPELAYIL